MSTYDIIKKKKVKFEGSCVVVASFCPRLQQALALQILVGLLVDHISTRVFILLLKKQTSRRMSRRLVFIIIRVLILTLTYLCVWLPPL